MHSFQKITTDIMEINPFDKIGKDWMLVTAGNEQKVNTMTASWGALGQMWGKDAAFVVIRQSRFTKEFIDREGKFSLSFPKNDYKKLMKFLGSVSGRDEDKIKESGVEIGYYNGVPYIDQADLLLICKVMSATLIKPEDFKDKGIDMSWYKDKDYHTLYIAEITDFLAR
ncbi:MAG: flavin reductase family protein [Lachnospiraceae bacterium]|nr:flavin reductase family protein [Lachnospiraceae bacterium]MDE7053125.1 flavin reductase [Lachnospiraceae bacterium]